MIKVLLKSKQEMKEFKEVYANAVREKKSMFIYKGHELFTYYAKQLISTSK